MALNVKNKIWLGTGFLFLLLLLTGGVSIYSLTKLKTDSKNILIDNYLSVNCGHIMQQQLLSLHSDYGHSIGKFEYALKQQQNNITEKGEREATDSLTADFNKLKRGDSTSENIERIENDIQEILTLNMNAIDFKNQKAEATADKALTLTLMLSSLIFLVSFSFLLNFPTVVTRPINQLNTAIKAIGEKDYGHRIHIDTKDEFGQLANAFNEMAEKLQDFEHSNLNQLMFQKKRAEAVINSMRDASIGIDKNDNVLFANHQALQLLGLKPEDIVGRNTQDVRHKNDLFRFLLENESASPFKIVIDNRENFFTKEVLDIPDGEGSSKVIVLKNITSFKELDVAKTNFIATVSHELKTPLASSDFSLKLLEDERISTLTPGQRELIENLKADNKRMLKILSELLNMSQVEAGRIQLNIKAIDPLEILENSLKNVAVNAKQKEITFTSDLQKNLPLIKADTDKTTWVLNNFLTNAIKYSSNRAVIEITVSATNGTITFAVTDHGPGIDKEYLPRLFERYFQVPGSKEKGTGLGLAISKEFIEAEGGKIWVDSEIAKGSTFYFSLPVAEPHS